jgi:hypothetical protein
MMAKKYSVWRGGCMQFKWHKRAADYDLYLDRLKQTEKRKTIEAQGEAHRAVTGKMLAVVTKKLDLMNPSELTQNTVTEWVETAVKLEREAAGLVGTTETRDERTPKQLTFSPEFDGL